MNEKMSDLESHSINVCVAGLGQSNFTSNKVNQGAPVCKLLFSQVFP